MLAHRDPKRATIAHLTKGQSWTDFYVQSTLGTYPEPVWNKEGTQNGFGPCGNPFHGNEEWHLLQQLWCNTNRQLSYNEKKQLPVHKLFQYSCGSKKSTPDKISDLVPIIWLVINDT